MHKVEAGLLFCELSVIKAEDDILQESFWVKFSIDLDLVDLFWEINENVTDNAALIGCTKIFAQDEFFIIKIPFEIFSDLLIKHRNSFKGIMN